MKRKAIVSVVGALLICALLPGCGKESSVSDAEIPPSQSELVVDFDFLTIKEKIEFILGRDDPFLDEANYCYRSGGKTWAYIDGEYYCADTVYPSDEWTPSDVVDSYINHTAPWVAKDNCYYLWSSDYEHSFEITRYNTYNPYGVDIDWLYVDGSRTLPVVQSTAIGDISPTNLIRLYKNDEWKGRVIFCAESPTLMVDGIDSRGRIIYYYDKIDMTDETASVAIDLVRSWDNCYINDSDKPQAKCASFIYPDLPDGYIEDIHESYRDYYEPNGTYISILDYEYSKKIGNRCAGARVEWYKKGELLQSWDLTPEKTLWGSNFSKLICFGDECYFFHYDTLWHLLEDGSIEVVLNDVIDYNYIWDGMIAVFYNRDDEVVYLPPLSYYGWSIDDLED